MTDDRKPRLALVESSFTKPEAQECLGGALGLTTRQLASALGAQHQHVNERIRRNRRLLAAQGFKIADSVVNTTEEKRSTFIVDVDTAKYLAATWRNDVGLSYFRYLLECERVTEQVMPRLIEEVARLRVDISALTVPRHRRLPGHGLVTFIKRVIRETDIFGDTTARVVTERKTLATMNDDEKRAYAVQHRAKTMRGLSEAQDCDINYVGFPRLPN